MLDIGETLQVDAWDADGTARVPYRGTAWTVRFAGPGHAGARANTSSSPCRATSCAWHRAAPR